MSKRKHILRRIEPENLVLQPLPPERRTYISLSFSCLPATEKAINRRAAELGWHSRSDYLRDLFEQDVKNASWYHEFSEAKTALPRIRRN
jgi:hypothetical protein